MRISDCSSDVCSSDLESCGRHRVARLRRRHGVVTLRRRRFLRARAPYQRVPAAPNRLAWPFASAALDRVWVGDITHIPTREGWLYLAAVLDVCSRRIDGWAMATQQTRDLAAQMGRRSCRASGGKYV